MTAMVGTQLGEDRLGNPQAPDADEPILRLESRLARLRASHSYGLVLLAVISSLVFTALVPDGAWLQSALVLLLAALLIVALWTSGVARLRSYPVVILLAVAGAAAAGRSRVRCRSSTQRSWQPP